MKLLRKLLAILPIALIGLTLLLAMVTFFLGLGDVIVYHYTDCLSGNSCVQETARRSVYFDDYYVDNNLGVGNFFSIFGFLWLCVALIFSIINLSNKKAKGPWLLIAGIISFIAEFWFLARPIILNSVVTSYGIGVAFQAFNWVTFLAATLIWIPCIVLFVLNKTLFKKVLNGETAPKKEEAPKAEQKSDWFCPECGTKNDGAFCINCGGKKPE